MCPGGSGRPDWALGPPHSTLQIAASYPPLFRLPVTSHWISPKCIWMCHKYVKKCPKKSKYFLEHDFICPKSNGILWDRNNFIWLKHEYICSKYVYICHINAWIFTELAHWVDLVIESHCPSVCLRQFKTPTSRWPGDFWLKGVLLIWAWNDKISVFFPLQWFVKFFRVLEPLYCEPAYCG